MKYAFNKTVFRRFVALALAMAVCVFAANAQSSGDKLYNQGLKLQKTMTVAAQNQAIAKFQSAKKLYDSQAKKAQCDNAISVSRNIISSLKSSPNPKPRNNYGGGTPRQEAQPEKPKATLSLSNTIFNLGQAGDSMEVIVTTNQPEWSVDAVTNSDGSGFVEVQKVDENTFRVEVPFNGESAPRTQYVQVSAGDASERLTVSQAGREIVLKADKTAVEAKKKGDKKKITVSCNSGEKYADNYNQNWHVLQCPEWITVAPKEQKNNLLSKAKKWGKDQAEKYGFAEGEDDSIVQIEVELIIDPISSGSSRKGEVILESGYKQFKISVNQYK